MISLFVFKDLVIYLKKLQREGGERDLPSIGSLPQMSATVGARADQSGKQELHLSFPRGNQEAKHLGFPLLPSQARLQGVGLEMEQLGLEPVLIWDTSIQGSNNPLHHNVSPFTLFMLVDY